MTSNPSRTWDSVCQDCSHYTQDSCTAGYITAGASDFIAAVCTGFLPIETAKTENGDG